MEHAQRRGPEGSHSLGAASVACDQVLARPQQLLVGRHGIHAPGRCGEQVVQHRWQRRHEQASVVQHSGAATRRVSVTRVRVNATVVSTTSDDGVGIEGHREGQESPDASHGHAQHAQRVDFEQRPQRHGSPALPHRHGHVDTRRVLGCTPSHAVTVAIVVTVRTHGCQFRLRRHVRAQLRQRVCQHGLTKRRQLRGLGLGQLHNDGDATRVRAAGTGRCGCGRATGSPVGSAHRLHQLTACSEGHEQHRVRVVEQAFQGQGLQRRQGKPRTELCTRDGLQRDGITAVATAIGASLCQQQRRPRCLVRAGVSNGHCQGHAKSPQRSRGATGIQVHRHNRVAASMPQRAAIVQHEAPQAVAVGDDGSGGVCGALRRQELRVDT